MTPTALAELAALTQGIEALLHVVNSVNIPALVALIVGTPSVLVAGMIYMNHLQTKRSEAQQKEFRDLCSTLLKEYKHDMHEVSDKHADALKLHEFAIGQLKASSQSNEVLHTVVVGNTKALEKLSFIIENKKG